MNYNKYRNQKIVDKLIKIFSNSKKYSLSDNSDDSNEIEIVIEETRYTGIPIAIIKGNLNNELKLYENHLIGLDKILEHIKMNLK